jgi:hypothetical protein
MKRKLLLIASSFLALMVLVTIVVSVMHHNRNMKYTLTDLGWVSEEGVEIDINDRSEILLSTRSPEKCLLIEIESGERRETEIPLVHNGNRVIPVAIDNSSEIVFRFLDKEKNQYRLLVLDSTGETTMGPPLGAPELPVGVKILDASAPLVVPKGLNDEGKIVGDTKHRRFENTAAGTGGFSKYAFCWENESGWIPLDPEKATIRRACDINNLGYAVGGGSSGHAILVDPNGKATNIGSLGGMGNGVAHGINDRMAVVGASSQRRRWKVPVRADRTLTNLGMNGLRDWLRSKAWRDHERHACLWESGEVVDLNYCTARLSDWELLKARAINNQGQIVGLGEYRKQPHAFLLTPI